MSLPSITPSDFCRRRFDYLVVGGGTAGLAVAARLSEDPEISVGVIEAGPAAFGHLSIDVPGRFGETITTPYDWQFETIQQPGLAGRKLPWPRGKVLGGSSALNFMVWNRGNADDYDAWEKLGNYGWGWDGLLPFFKKSETFTQPELTHQEQHHSYYNPEFHGTDGPIKTGYLNEFSISHKYWHNTLNKLDVQTNKDPLAGSNVGVWTAVTAVDPSSTRRSYAAGAYYLPNASRQNLVVLTDAIARNVVLEREEGNWVAKGVRFAHGNEEFLATVSGEVILSAGSVQSPQLLELSGVGDPSILRNAGIDVKVDNSNVGENLQDHMMTVSVYEINPSLASPDDLKLDSKLAEEADRLFTTSQSGPRSILACSMCYLPLSQFIPLEKLASFASRAVSATTERRIQDDILASRFTPSSRLGQIEYIFDIGNWSTAFASLPGKKYGTMLQILQYPFSRGSIHIPPRPATGRSTTSDDKPVIDPKYYEGRGGKIDFDVMTAAQKFGDRICRTAPLCDMIRGRVFPPDTSASDRDEDEDLAAWVRNNTVTDWHPVGTCGMGGSAGIKDGVVDERLRVYGVRGLRVVDASVMPMQISAHLQATVYAIAEKGASMILEDRRGMRRDGEKMETEGGKGGVGVNGVGVNGEGMNAVGVNGVGVNGTA